MHMGGLGGAAAIDPGESFWYHVPLWRSCEILEPNVYTIRVYHDLGWDADSHVGLPPSN